MDSHTSDLIEIYGHTLFSRRYLVRFNSLKTSRRFFVAASQVCIEWKPYPTRGSSVGKEAAQRSVKSVFAAQVPKNTNSGAYNADWRSTGTPLLFKNGGLVTFRHADSITALMIVVSNKPSKWGLMTCTHRRSQGGAHATQMFSIYSHFVLGEAVSQTK